MIVIQILGTSPDSREEQLQTITADLLRLCREMCGDDGYVAFPVDRMQMDLGREIVVLVSGVKSDVDSCAFGEKVRTTLVPHFLPFIRGIKIGVQVIEARTVREFTKKEEPTCP